MSENASENVNETENPLIPEIYENPVEFQIIFEDSAGRRIHGYIEANGWDDIQKKIKPCVLVSTMRVIR